MDATLADLETWRDHPRARSPRATRSGVCRALGCHRTRTRRTAPVPHRPPASQAVRRNSGPATDRIAGPIRVIIGTPDERASTRFHRTAGWRLFRPVAPAEKVSVAHGVVPSVEGLTFPPEFEHSFHDTALIARILIDGSPALSRPTDDLNRKLSGASTRHPYPSRL
jgi:hypothetical protein